MVFVASFSKVSVFSEVFRKNDPSTRQLYHYNTTVLKSFHFGDRFQKLSLSVKTIIVLYRFRVNARGKRKEKFEVSMKTI